tara:strand:+ start:502 stop:756 length:255 start_codon:yes stop_codon:yes gene_type:complete
MKYIELTGYGNHKLHLIPINAIVSFSFEKKDDTNDGPNHFSTIQFSSGNTLNVIETKEEIHNILNKIGGEFITSDSSHQIQING